MRLKNSYDVNIEFDCLCILFECLVAKSQNIASPFEINILCIYIMISF